MTDQIIGMIPARYGSTRFPGKPLIPILGKTLLQRTYENACQSSALQAVVVATDDQRIFDHVESFGGHAVMTSPNCATGTDRLAEALQLNPQWMRANVIVNIQGDEPCLRPQEIDQVVEALTRDPTASMSTLITPLTDQEEALNPSIVKCVADRQQNALYFSHPQHAHGIN